MRHPVVFLIWLGIWASISIYSSNAMMNSEDRIKRILGCIEFDITIFAVFWLVAKYYLI